jgi:hypothetical protein
MENCIIAFNGLGEAFFWGAESELTLTGCSIYGNDGGDWVGDIEDQYGIRGNIQEDPLLCDPDNGDLRLRENSPCAPFSPPNVEYDLLGAWPVGCDVSGVAD